LNETDSNLYLIYMFFIIGNGIQKKHVLVIDKPILARDLFMIINFHEKYFSHNEILSKI
jgi:hypothetical protein